MGTRCLTIIKDGQDKLVNMYRQMDGYPDGHGQELADFLSGKTLINGITISDGAGQFNGMGCLAASVVSHFKNGIGGFYLYPTDERDIGEEYMYEVFSREGSIYMKVTDTYEHKIIFEGRPENFKIEENV